MSVPPPDSRDRLPLWVILLLAVFLVLRVLELHGDWTAARGGRVSSLAGQVDSKTMSATMSVNTEAKTAFAAALAQPGGGPDPKALRQALAEAEGLQSLTGNAPSAARRVLILRALLRRPLLGPGRSRLDPIAAFAAAPAAGQAPAEDRQGAAEGKLWRDVAAGSRLAPSQVAADAALLRAVPNIRWWRYPALSVLYGSQGDASRARRYAAQAQAQAALTLLPLGLMTLLWLVLGLGGLGLLLYFATRRRLSPDPQGTPGALLPDPWPAVRETVPLNERRLRAGDLMGVFVLYLLMPNLVGWLVGGFGVRHVFHFGGLIAPYRAHLLGLSSGSRVAAVVVLEFAAYLLGAGVPIAVLVAIARRKRASLAEELGFNTHRLGWNLLYGVGGYAIALPLVILSSLAGPRLFRHAPAPSNPAIPLLANAASPWVQILLVALATIAAPLCEELLFRGVFYNAAKLKVGVWPAIVLTGLIFGFVHPVGIAEMLPLAVLGGVFAWMAETRKSLVPSMLGHFLQNSFATAMLLLALGG